LVEALHNAWIQKNQVFLCGNGGSGANALHFANDLIYGLGLKVHALLANQSILTCLANDICYEDVFSYQLAVLGEPGDILIAFSGSGNSPNIIKAIQKAKELDMKTFAFLGYSGGKAIEQVDVAIYFPIDNMQIAEDCQQIVGHMVMQWLVKNRH
jgi:D-sedoheptulose 7-phosphate isomerase